jgi:hypothetical protein
MFHIYLVCMTSVLQAAGAEGRATLAPATPEEQKLFGPGNPSGYKLGPAPRTVKTPLPGDALYAAFTFDGNEFSVGMQKDTWTFYVDLNRDGEFKDDEKFPSKRNASMVPSKEQKPTELVTHAAELTITRTQDGKEYQYPINLAVAEFNPETTAPANTLLVVRRYGRTGQVMLGGKTYKAWLDDPTTRGAYGYEGNGPSKLDLYIDFDRDERIHGQFEKVDPSRTFKLSGKPFRVRKINPSGTLVEFDNVEDTPSFYDTGLGAKIEPFRAPALDGTVIKFPEDYGGKKVIFVSWSPTPGTASGLLARLSTLLENFGSKGLAVIGVCVAKPEDKQACIDAASIGMSTSRSIFDGHGLAGPFCRRLGLNRASVMLVVDTKTMTVVVPTKTARLDNLPDWFNKLFPK